jgi:hypothetical protein
MATKAKKMTGKDIATADVLRAVGDGATFQQAEAALWGKDPPFGAARALDGALQREKRAGRVRFDRAERLWFKTDAELAIRQLARRRGVRKA